ncbi:MAG: hypothetical protein K2N38_13010 [Oscillospiraceae bacterium]|nr:hypothetical protein [Oscillospiraceae bacterium]
MKTIFFAIITILALVMIGCSNAVSEPDMSDVGSDISNVVYEADMPDIVFKKCTVCNRYEHDFDDDESSEQGRYMLTFLDKNGNYYFSDYSEIFLLSNEELIETLRSGDERITKSSVSRDVDELRENYKKLLKVADNKEYELVYPEALPDVEADRITWYGLYFDKDGHLSSLPIHKNERLTGINANDDRANEIYEWYSSAAKTQ